MQQMKLFKIPMPQTVCNFSLIKQWIVIIVHTQIVKNRLLITALHDWVNLASQCVKMGR